MKVRVMRSAAVVLFAALLGCAAPGATGAKAPVFCPACKVKTVTHRFRRLRVPAHTHVTYLCPSCGKEWTGEEEGGACAVCPACGKTLKECPGCCGKGAANHRYDG
jgi:hypothetical protein